MMAWRAPSPRLFFARNEMVGGSWPTAKHLACECEEARKIAAARNFHTSAPLHERLKSPPTHLNPLISNLAKASCSLRPSNGISTGYTRTARVRAPPFDHDHATRDIE